MLTAISIVIALVLAYLTIGSAKVSKFLVLPLWVGYFIAINLALWLIGLAFNTAVGLFHLAIVPAPLIILALLVMWLLRKASSLKLLILLPPALLLVGCEDPEKAVLEKGRNIDIRNMEGTVVAIEVKQFKGDNDYTKDVKGQNYYIVKISRSADGSNPENFDGVPVGVAKALRVGDRLPGVPLLTFEDLKRTTGKVMEKQCDLKTNRYYVAIDQGASNVQTYGLEPSVYFNDIRVGMTLPLDK